MVQRIGGPIEVITLTPTVEVAAYTAGDFLSAKLEFLKAADPLFNRGVIKSISIIDNAGQEAATDVVFFDTDPSNTVFGSRAVSATIAGGGTGYTVGDDITLVGGTGTAAIFNVDTVSSGVITAVSIISGSEGDYTVEPSNPVSVTGGTGTGATLTVTFTSVADLADADLLNFVGSVSLTSYLSYDKNSTAFIETDIPYNLGERGTSLFAAFITRGTPTYVLASDLSIRIVVKQT